MIFLAPIKEKEEIERLFKAKNFVYNEFSGCLAAKDGEEVLGLCLYYLDGEKMTVLHIEPTNDIAFADGILRSTLHVATEKSIMKAYYTNTVSEEFLNKIGFVKDSNEKTLDTDKLFKSCCSCK